jgi:hypothetical protein
MKSENYLLILQEIIPLWQEDVHTWTLKAILLKDY